MRDAQGDPQVRQIFEQMRQQNEECVKKLCERLGIAPKRQTRQ
jgi:hypothetical protein